MGDDGLRDMGKRGGVRTTGNEVSPSETLPSAVSSPSANEHGTGHNATTQQTTGIAAVNTNANAVKDTNIVMYTGAGATKSSVNDAPHVVGEAMSKCEWCTEAEGQQVDIAEVTFGPITRYRMCLACRTVVMRRYNDIRIRNGQQLQVSMRPLGEYLYCSHCGDRMFLPCRTANLVRSKVSDKPMRLCFGCRREYDKLAIDLTEMEGTATSPTP